MRARSVRLVVSPFFRLLWLVAFVALAGCDRAMDSVFGSILDRAEVELLEDGNLHVILCGTGNPNADPDRRQSCTAILAGGEFVLDAGAGAALSAELLGLPIVGLTAVVVTHFHQDHIGGLGEVISNTWALGRKRPMNSR